MAKGDQKRYQNQLDRQGNLSQSTMDATRQTLGQTRDNFYNNYNRGFEQNLGDYSDIMNRYRSAFDQGLESPSFGGGAVGWNTVTPQQIRMVGNEENPSIYDKYRTEGVDRAMAGYGNFADTGGFSGQDIQDIRARAIGPTRSVFSSAQSGLDRQRALQGGYSPNYTAASAKLARDLASGISDANVNANASIAQMIQQGKLAGLGGLERTGMGQQGLFLQGDVQNQGADLQAALANATGQQRAEMANQDAGLRAQQLGALYGNTGNTLGVLGGMTNLLGITPGFSNMTGNQLLNSQQQQLELQRMQNQQGMDMIGAQFNRHLIPGNYQSALGNIGGTMGILGQAGSILAGLPQLGRQQAPTQGQAYTPQSMSNLFQRQNPYMGGGVQPYGGAQPYGMQSPYNYSDRYSNLRFG